MKWIQTMAMCWVVFTLAPGEAMAADEWGLRIGAENFRWREFDGGARLVEESGLRYNLGGSFEKPVSPDALTTVELQGNLYLGTVDYDGTACNIISGVCVPSSSDTKYDGFKTEISFARHYPASGGGAYKFLGTLGLDSWKRDISSTAAAAGGVENWTVIYGALGAGWRSPAFMLRGGVKLPLSVTNSTDLGVDVKPKGRASLFLRFAVPVHDTPRQRWTLGAFYDSYRFAESDHVLVSTNIGLLQVWQPKSEQDVWGFEVTANWR